MPLTNAAAVPADGKIVVIGGTRTVAGDQTAEILAFPATGHPITVLGTLPVKLDDAAAVSTPTGFLVLGGVEDDGQTNATIYKVRVNA